MSKAKKPLLIALAVLLAASACLTTLPATAQPQSISSINLTATSLVKILTFAPRNTVIATQPAPSETATISASTTPFPSITPLPTATATYTVTPFGFVASATPITPSPTVAALVETPDPAEGATDDWGSDYRCSLINKSPANWTEMKAKQKYQVTWTLLNSGVKRWQTDAVILVYVDGADLNRNERTSKLVRDVKVDEAVTPIINILTPNEPGRYRSVWGLRVVKTGHVFCTFTVKITVK
jgi:hypothetical protein